MRSCWSGTPLGVLVVCDVEGYDNISSLLNSSILLLYVNTAGSW